MKESLRKVLAVLAASGVAIGVAALVLSGPVQAQTPGAQRSFSSPWVEPGGQVRPVCRFGLGKRGNLQRPDLDRHTPRRD